MRRRRRDKQERIQIKIGNNLRMLPGLEADSVDAIVTDPPYGLSFMGKNWDLALPDPQIWVECLRVIKPGGHMVVFGAPRLYHRLACQIEDAGWELRDCLMWVFGSGFPKSRDVSKALDNAAGADRTESESCSPYYDGHVRAEKTADYPIGSVYKRTGGALNQRSLPATDLAQQWDGWGTALKPAYEPILLCRRPLAGTVVANVSVHGVGGINIEGCRIGTDGRPKITTVLREKEDVFVYTADRGTTKATGTTTLGRWPSNILFNPEAAELLDAQSGISKSVQSKITKNQNSPGDRVALRDGLGYINPGNTHSDSGGASRFFYTSKASRRERDMGNERVDGKRANDHPTVKPTDLMQWLCRLITPKNGLVLDPFMGSGSTGVAALAEGFRFMGIELDRQHCKLARRRMEIVLLPGETHP